MADNIIYDSDAERSYKLTESMDEYSLHLEFDPAIPVMTGCEDPDYPYCYAQTHRLSINILGKEWVLSALEKDENRTYVVLGDEESYAIIIMGESIKVGDDEIEFADHIWGRENILKSKTNETLTWTAKPGTYDYGNRQVRVWKSLELGPQFSWVGLSSLYETIELSDPANNVLLIWENEGSANPALKSISVPASSPIFDKLTVQSTN